jgi:hypothetical protein
MKLTKSQLRKIIKEELGKISEQEVDSEEYLGRVRKGITGYLDEMDGEELRTIVRFIDKIRKDRFLKTGEVPKEKRYGSDTHAIGEQNETD